MNAVPPLDGERFYLRLLLNHIRGPTSFDDLRTINLALYNTFMQGVKQMGLLERNTAIFDYLSEASVSHMLLSLKRPFVSILFFCNPVVVRRLWDEFYSYMIELPLFQQLYPCIRLLAYGPQQHAVGTRRVHF